MANSKSIAIATLIVASTALLQLGPTWSQERGTIAVRSGGNERIVGGDRVKESRDAPWAVVFLLDGKFHCGGSLVAPRVVDRELRKVSWAGGIENSRWVITAAHCLYDHSGQRLSANQISVLSGSLDRFKTEPSASGREEVIPVRFVMEHEDYNSSTLENDVALLFLDQPAKSINARIRSSIKLPQSDEIRWAYAPYTQAIAQGWGASATSSSNQFLYEVRVPIVDDATCQENYSLRGHKVYDGMICAGYARGQHDSCSGDSGGPLIFRPRDNATAQNTFLTGVVSWGVGCALPDLAGIYSSTAYFQRWLDKAFLKCESDPVSANCTRAARSREITGDVRYAPNMITGNLELFPEGCDTQANAVCKLAAPLRFIQSSGLAWESDVWQSDDQESGTTDGASIPAWAQPVIGAPFDRSYLKAAIIHDHYCYKENHVRSWRQTHRMFYEALLASGISTLKARTMYYAVLVGGPRWKNLVAGEDCGPNCLKNRFEAGTATGDDWVGDLYDRPLFASEVQQFHAEQSTDGLMDLDEVERRAQQDRNELLAN